MLTPEAQQADQIVLARIAARLSAAMGPESLVATTAQLIRQAIDEVIDAPRTRRLVLSECEKTEKTYLGTKIEILLRSAMRLPKGRVLDLDVGGEEVDIKHTIARTWMIPQEAVGRVCLLVSEDEPTALFSLGLLMCRPENLSVSRNQDRKFSTSSDGLTRALWLARRRRYPANIWLHMDGIKRAAILNERAGSRRVAALFREMQRQPIARTAITAAAPQLDPLKRVRANGGARDILRPESIAILWGSRDREAISRLGLSPLYSDEFISLAPRNDAERAVLIVAGHLDA